MAYAFQGCTLFNQSLAAWSLASIQSDGLVGMLDLTGLSVASFEATLQGWLSGGVPYGVSLGCAGLATTGPWSLAVIENTLINKYGWTFQDASAVYYYSTTDISGLVYGDIYQIQVKANNTVGSSSWSAPSAAFSLAPAVPDAPTGLSIASTPGTPVVLLTWNAPTDLHGSTLLSYELYIVPTPGSPYSLSTSGIQTYLSVPLNYVVSYVFQVRAVSDQGNSAYSSPTVPFVLTPTPSDPPTHVHVQQTVPGSSIPNVVVSWTPPYSTHGNTLVSYTVQIQSPGGSTFQTTPGTTPSLEIDGLSINTYYVFSVQANMADPAFNSPYSSPSPPFQIVQQFPYYTPKRTSTYANISTALRYSQYISTFTRSTEPEKKAAPY